MSFLKNGMKFVQAYARKASIGIPHFNREIGQAERINIYDILKRVFTISSFIALFAEDTRIVLL